MKIHNYRIAIHVKTDVFISRYAENDQCRLYISSFEECQHATHAKLQVMNK